jgi:hypothetical protein
MIEAIARRSRDGFSGNGIINFAHKRQAAPATGSLSQPTSSDAINLAGRYDDTG